MPCWELIYKYSGLVNSPKKNQLTEKPTRQNPSRKNKQIAKFWSTHKNVGQLDKIYRSTRQNFNLFYFNNL